MGGDRNVAKCKLGKAMFGGGRGVGSRCSEVCFISTVCLPSPAPILSVIGNYKFHSTLFQCSVGGCLEVVCVCKVAMETSQRLKRLLPSLLVTYAVPTLSCTSIGLEFNVY